MMKHTLFSVALLIAASACAPLGSPTSAKPLTPIALTNELQMKLSGSQWDGDWYDTGRGEGGVAGLYLMMSYGWADVRVSIQSDAAGNYTYPAHGRIKGNTMKLKSRGGNTMISLSLFREKGRLVLKGEYEVIGGEYSGESGTYYFKKK